MRPTTRGGTDDTAAIALRARRPLPALVRYHLLGPARVAQRNGLLAIGIAVVLTAFSPGSALDKVRDIALSLAAGTGPPGAALAFSLFGAALAIGGLSTVGAGLGGWLRSVPVGGRDHRRAVTVALLCPMAPLLAVELLAVVLVPLAYGAPLAAAKIVGLPLGMLAAAASVTPSRRALLARPLALAAAVLVTAGRWDTLALGVAALGVGELVAGPLVTSRRTHAPDGRITRRLLVRVAARAVGWRGMGALAAPLVLIGFAHLYRVNNEYSAAQAAPVLRSTALLAITLLLATLADILLVRRPAWPWARSLPVGSRRRVVGDAMVLAAWASVPTLLVMREDWRTGVVVLAAMPLLLVHASGAIRRGRGRMTRAGGEIVAVGLGITTAVAIWPWAACLSLLLVPLALAAGERADQWTVVTAWDELHHSVEGDSLAGSAQ